jgi:hypothetical protein
LCHTIVIPYLRLQAVNAAAAAEAAAKVDWPVVAKELDAKSPLEIMDHVS